MATFTNGGIKINPEAVLPAFYEIYKVDEVVICQHQFHFSNAVSSFTYPADNLPHETLRLTADTRTAIFRVRRKQIINA